MFERNHLTKRTARFTDDMNIFGFIFESIDEWDACFMYPVKQWARASEDIDRCMYRYLLGRRCSEHMKSIGLDFVHEVTGVSMCECLFSPRSVKSRVKSLSLTITVGHQWR